MTSTDPKKSNKKDQNTKQKKEDTLPIDEPKAFEDIFDHIDVDNVSADKTNPSDDAPSDTEDENLNKDDLTRIEWIWPKIQELLYKAKILTFEELAAQTPGKIRTILANAGGHFKSHDPSTRPEQSRLAQAGRRAELDALQEYLDKGKKAKEEQKKKKEEKEKLDKKEWDKEKSEQKTSWDIEEKNIQTNTIDLDSEKQQIDIEKKDTKKTKSSSKDTETHLDIEDISSYIQKTKDEQKIQDTTPRAQDGTDLTTLPDLYAVVPHNKGDHKLVYLRKDMPSTLLDDEKWRTKGSIYKKKGMKIYDVHADFKEHPLLKSKNGEMLDVWVVDSPDDLTLQLQAIQQGKWGGINFKAPLILKPDLEKWTKKKWTVESLDPLVDSQDDKVKKDIESSSPDAEQTNTKPRDVTTENTEETEDMKPRENTETKNWDLPTNTPDIEEKKPWETTEEKWVVDPLDEKHAPKETNTKPRETTKEEWVIESQETQENTPDTLNLDDITLSSDETKNTEESDTKPWDMVMENTETGINEKVTGKETTNKNTETETNTHDLDNIVIAPDLPTDEHKEETPSANNLPSENKPIDENTTDLDNENETLPWQWFRNPNGENALDSETPTENMNLDNIISEPVKQNEDSVNTPDTENTFSPEETNTVSETTQDTTTKDVVSDTTPEHPIYQESATNNTPDEFQDNEHSNDEFHDEFDDNDDDEDDEERGTALKEKIKLIAKIVGALVILILFFLLWKIMFSTGDAEKKEDNTQIKESIEIEDQAPSSNIPHDDTVSGVAGKLWLPTDTKINTDTKKEKELDEDISNITTPTEISFTIPELIKKLEAQQKEAQRLLKKAKFIEDKTAIKFTMTAIVKTTSILNEIDTNPNITANEVQKKATKIDLYIQAATKILK